MMRSRKSYLSTFNNICALRVFKIIECITRCYLLNMKAIKYLSLSGVVTFVVDKYGWCALSLSLSHIYIISFIISFRRHNQIERSSIFSLCFLIECGCKTDTLLGAILTNLVVTLLGMTMDMLQFCFSFIFFFLSFNVTWYRSRVFFLYEWYAGCF